MSSGHGFDLVVRNSQLVWLNVRRYLNGNRPALTRAAAELYPDATRVGSTLLMSAPEWLASTALDLGAIEMSWNGDASPAQLTGREPATERVRALRSAGQPYETYSDTVEALDRPRLFENRATYRLIGGDLPGGRLEFARGSYFDVINVSEAVAHEFAAAQLDAGGADPRSLPFRSLIGSPFDLERRPLTVALSALTLRVDAASHAGTFVLHWRDPKRVASGGGLYQVMPVGVFQPTTDAPGDVVNDFDLWRNLVREYSEEFLGAPERQGERGAPLDYDAWPFYRAMSEARSSGAVRPYCFGIGIDPLTLVADILVAVAFEAHAFDELLGSMVASNEEGSVVTLNGSDNQGVPFTERDIRSFLVGRPMQPAGAAVLDRAWKHRDVLLGMGRRSRSIAL